jgi:hypothetical protein
LFKDGHIEIWDITYRKRLNDPDNVIRFEGTRKICEERGWVYRLVFIEDLPHGIEKENIDLLYVYRARILENKKIANATLSLLRKVKDELLVDLVTKVAERTGFQERRVRFTLLHMAWTGEINIDLKKCRIVIRGKIMPSVVVIGKGS